MKNYSLIFLRTIQIMGIAIQISEREFFHLFTRILRDISIGFRFTSIINYFDSQPLFIIYLAIILLTDLGISILIYFLIRNSRHQNNQVKPNRLIVIFRIYINIYSWLILNIKLDFIFSTISCRWLASETPACNYYSNFLT